MEDEALGTDGAEPEEIRAGGSSCSCISCLIDCMGAVENIDGFSK